MKKLDGIKCASTFIRSISVLTMLSKNGMTQGVAIRVTGLGFSVYVKALPYPKSDDVSVPSNGSPLSGASVKFVVSGSTVCTTTTKANGQASCTYRTGTNGRIYTWYVVVSKQGYATTQSTPPWTFHT